jgi:hypothetical protein
MSGEQNQLPQPPERIVRYSLRTTLLTTAGLAIILAVGGWLYRDASPDGQSNLLKLWGVTGLSFALCSAWMFRRPFDRGAKRQVRYIAYRTSNWSLGRNRFMRTASIAAVVAWIGFASYVIATEPAEKKGGVISIGFWSGLAVAMACLSFIRQSLHLCEEGIPTGRRTLAPWKYIRHAEWLLHRPNVMRLHQLGGDVFLDIPLSMRDEVEAFVRGKTLFIDDLPPRPRFEEPGAKEGRG